MITIHMTGGLSCALVGAVTRAGKAAVAKVLLILTTAFVMHITTLENICHRARPSLVYHTMPLCVVHINSNAHIIFSLQSHQLGILTLELLPQNFVLV